MSETKIINRTAESFGQKLERERLEGETAAESEGLAPTPVEQLQIVAGVPVGRKLAVEEIGLAKSKDGVLREKGLPSVAPQVESAQVDREEQIETLIAQVATAQTETTHGSPNWIGPGAEPTLTPELETAVKQILLGRHAPRDPDLRDFRDQVIAAFKHLGLDTRKFFGV